MTTNPPTGRARGIDRVIALMDYLHRRREPTRITDIARDTGMPRSTVYELINTLVEARWLDLREREGMVYFGPAMHYYGHDYTDGVDMIRKARAEVSRLAATIGETAQFCMLDGNKYTVVLNESGRRMFRISSDVGVKVPIPWTASGRLLVGHMGAGELRDFIPADDFVLPDGRRIDSDAFMAEMDTARAKGFARTTGLVDRFTTCLAVPIRDPSGRCVATVCFVVPAETAPERQSEMIDVLKATATGLASPA